MNKTKLENIKHHLDEKLNDPRFRHAYETERMKVSLAQKIAELRQDCHLTQNDLAKRLGVSQQYVSQIETGEAKNLTLDTLSKLSNSLNTDVTISFTRPLHKKHPSLMVV